MVLTRPGRLTPLRRTDGTAPFTPRRAILSGQEDSAMVKTTGRRPPSRGRPARPSDRTAEEAAKVLSNKRASKTAKSLAGEVLRQRS